jgi:hypothetical protein
MNSVVARARGEFIAILNSDDFAFPGRLEIQVSFLRAHPKIAAVFSMPFQVGEEGQAADVYERFATPFVDSNASRQEWLRHLFFHGNCLCAPTAMIRRSAYLETGIYDPRFTNVQDLDRWTRLLEKHDIHVMSTELTAFRVRANNQNMSAPRRDSVLRTTFESFQILKRYRAYAPNFLREIFAEEIAQHGIDTSGPSGIWLAEIALLGVQAWHPLFALDTLFDAARNDVDFRRLRDVTGSLNAFGFPAPD